ncbi:M23 family metallopeptidase [Arthrobacter roseus]|uniref:M23 family metallopeptidase n=1 Tax=Arthrobacter roseus TaxID=136274 RepID=UPI0019647A20|nr:M23 family metallopeptidase [Arthrobacter roseus]MBM7847755.1 murein DD-endopeptidase MepM/ murein hydrolase activator NlpD [Arthrobacter roseus]
MSKHRASPRHVAPESMPEPRPRDAHRAARRRQPVTPRNTYSFTGIGQKVAMVAAVSGIALTVALPTTAAAPNAEAEAPKPQTSKLVSAASTAQVSFQRVQLGSEFDPERKLDSIMAASGGNLELAQAEGSLAAPLKTLEPTSSFGYRGSPITGIAEMHSGQDFASPCGSDVLAAASGVVKSAGWHAFGGGNRVVVDHGNGLETTYNHMSAITVTVGQQVERGDNVGASGSTGASTGCHLHFEVLVDGKAVDPNGWL